mmetsp:Transcript_11885/g.29281  ORF Transcript_11885/g.29281 Transcript_11885/m.29281 type:complete len:485 (+) Transcript_11885:162-1616(+)|eukprot:CAMPEP_0114512600 /NCGR_PEP_ID=MMETSP0109-20121206/15070_1 /TAXON_ID=29199 /ORGANISM="Chlorarachnion reptans, Strain CCCM449" /LENGTH=484 /DNA_ID=CAMNT_0001692311 /DNA_START=122 /DNA_END=1576 /DNA_ORIENTATION=-
MDKIISPRTPSQRQRLKPKDFEFGELLGEGSFAKVFMATRKENGKRYAAKVVDKQHVVKHKKVEAVMQEKKILSQCQHRGIVHLHFAFQDSLSFYFMLELVPGGELYELIERVGKLPVDLARFFAAEIFDVLEYLHSKGILHRDLKPENILLTEDRHVKLTDFGTAGILQGSGREIGGVDIANEKDSFVGTAEYVSPEILDGNEQSTACDLWSAGCTVYHMLVGVPPFRGASEYLTFQLVTQAKYTFPEGIDSEAKDIVQKLLVVDPKKRLGSKSMDEVKSHKFFSSIDWMKLMSMEAPKWKEPLSRDLLASQHILPNLKTDEGKSQAASTSSGTSVSVAKSGQKNKFDMKANTGQDEKTVQSNKSTEGIDTISLWRQFLIEGETVVFTGLIQKRSFTGVGFFSKRRQLVLTSFPRILYIDPREMRIRGEIPWSKNIVAEQKNRKNFVIHTHGKSYKLTCISHEADQWVKAIKSLKQGSAGCDR